MKRSNRKGIHTQSDPAREPHYRLLEEDRRRREDEFAARGREWAYTATDWMVDWNSGGRERAERQQSEAIARRKAEEEERVKQKREEDKKRRAEARADYTRWIKETEEEARRKAATNPEQAAQLARDDAYYAYLWSIGATLEALQFDLSVRMARLAYPDYGIGSKARFYTHVPPRGSSSFAQADPFIPLGLTRGATLDQVKAAYRGLAKRHHPDAGGDPDEFCRIKDAYDRCLQLVNPTLEA